MVKIIKTVRLFNCSIDVDIPLEFESMEEFKKKERIPKNKNFETAWMEIVSKNKIIRKIIRKSYYWDDELEITSIKIRLNFLRRLLEGLLEKLY